MLNKLKNFAWGYIFIGIILTGIGICFISFHNAFNVLAISIGVILTLSGIAIGIKALCNIERSFKFGVKIIFSIICIVCGIVTAITQSSAISAIANIFLLLLIIDGSFKLQTSILSKRVKIVMWWVMLVLSLTVIISSFAVAKVTIEEETTLSIVIGCIITVDGIQNLLSAFYITAYEKRHQKELKSASGEKEAEIIETVTIY